VALGLNQLIGGLIDRARPYETLTDVHLLVSRTTDFSFPSDHAVTVGAVAAGLLLAHRRLGSVTVEDHNPTEVKDAAALRALRVAFGERAEGDARLAAAVSAARADGHSWSSIGAMIGTSGEAARQRYGDPARHR